MVFLVFYIIRGDGRHDVSVNHLGGYHSARLHGGSTCFKSGLRHRCSTDAYYVFDQYCLQRYVRFNLHHYL